MRFRIYEWKVHRLGWDQSEQKNTQLLTLSCLVCANSSLASLRLFFHSFFRRICGINGRDGRTDGGRRRDVRQLKFGEENVFIIRPFAQVLSLKAPKLSLSLIAFIFIAFSLPFTPGLQETVRRKENWRSPTGGEKLLMSQSSRSENIRNSWAEGEIGISDVWEKVSKNRYPNDVFTFQRCIQQLWNNPINNKACWLLPSTRDVVFRCFPARAKKGLYPAALNSSNWMLFLFSSFFRLLGFC